jgi:beta-xylosidase
MCWTRRIELIVLFLIFAVQPACAQPVTGGTAQPAAGDAKPAATVPAPSLQSQIQSTARNIRNPDDPALAGLSETLRSLPGQIALGRILEALPANARTEALRRALNQISPAQRQNLATSADQQLPSLEQRAGGWSRQLDDAPLESRLRSLLQRPDGPAALLAISRADGPAPSPLPAEIAPYFRKNSKGTYTIPVELRGAAEENLKKSQPLIQAVNDAVARLQNLAAKMDANSAFARRYQSALREPLFAAAIALKFAQAGQNPENLPQAVESEAKKALRQRSDGRYELGSVDQRQIEQLLDTIDKAKAAAEPTRAQMAAAAKQIGLNDALHAGYREALNSPIIALAAAVKALEGGGDAGVMDQTALNDVFVKQGQSFAVTRWRRERAEFVIDRMQRLVSDAELIRPELDRAGVRGVARMSLADQVSQKVEDDPELRLGAWVDSTFTRDGQQFVARADARPALLKLIEQAKAIEKQLSAEPLVSADVNHATFDKSRLSLFKSSVFYDPRTAAARQIYLTEFPDHHAARLWGVFEWDVYDSKDFASFMQNLQSRQEEIAQLARTHEKLMVILSFTPSWLSSSNDDRPVEGHWHYRNAVRPKDWNTWERMVEQAVTFLTQYKDVQWYFEVWNEPDLPYWQEGVDEYLEMYQHTVAAVKRAAPSAKVGGSAVNGWQGKPAASPKRDPLNLELIQFVRKRNLPLDFLSWHVFSTEESEVRSAVDRYRAALRSAGFQQMPELIVSEWNIGSTKGTERAAGGFAERMLTFYEVGVSEQFFSAWEEFNPATPENDMVGPWGMITQQGRKKPEFYVHKLFDDLSRDSQGIAIFKSQDDTTRAIVSRDTDGRYSVLAWETGYPPGVLDAVQILQQNGVRPEAIDRYETMENLKAALASAKPIDNGNRTAFERARSRYEQGAATNLIKIGIPGASELKILQARRVASELEPAQRVYSSGREIVAEIPRMQVLWLRVEIKP